MSNGLFANFPESVYKLPPVTFVGSDKYPAISKPLPIGAPQRGAVMYSQRFANDNPSGINRSVTAPPAHSNREFAREAIPPQQYTGINPTPPSGLTFA